MPVLDRCATELVANGYRQITLRTYNDLIGGVRYVSLPRAVDDRDSFIAVQLTPSDPRSTWTVWRWSAEDGTGWLSASTRRSSCDIALGHSRLTEDLWFAKVAEHIDSNVILHPLGRHLKRDQHVSWPFFSFVGTEIGGYEPPFDVTEAFNIRHPADQVEDARQQLRRVEEELRTREAEIRQRDLFRYPEQLNAFAAEFERRGDSRLARMNRAMAEAERRRIQNQLDSEAQEARRAGRFYVPRLEDFNLGLAPPAPEPVASEPVHEIAPSARKRSIILEGEL